MSIVLAILAFTASLLLAARAFGALQQDQQAIPAMRPIAAAKPERAAVVLSTDIRRRHECR